MKFDTKSMLKSLKFFSFLFLLLLTAEVTYAQSNLNASNLSNVRAADVTDAQLRNFMNQSQSQGVTLEQAFQMAQQRGLQPSEAAKLRQRIQQLQMRSGDSDQQMMDGTGARERDRQRELVRPDREETELMERTFGSSVFRMQASEFTPLANVPTPASYTLGPGDELLISIWGDQTASYRLLVTPEGTVEIDNLGPVMVNGLTLHEAEEAVIANLRQLFSGLRESGDSQSTFARVSINRLRSVQVAVTGDVINPGSYAIPSSSTVFNALYRAGGPAENGSYRYIRVIRNNEILTVLDLYDFLVEGLQTGNIHRT